MVAWVVKPEESGGRMDKYLKKRLKSAPDSFFYKMARKKNLLLNGQKCSGKEILNAGDEIRLFVSDATVALFSGDKTENSGRLIHDAEKAFQSLKDIRVIEESGDLVFLFKPSGILTQKATDNDLSLNEWLIGYLLSKKVIDSDTLDTFHPSVCNRLDRNTSGIVICGITPRGSRFASETIKERSVKKYYHCIVSGKCSLSGEIKGFLVKDSSKNKSVFYKTEEEIPNLFRKTAALVSLSLTPIKSSGRFTLMEVQLHTGKSHQIRVMLSSLGYPIVGDPKYGNGSGKGQLLCAVRLEFPKIDKEEFCCYSNKIITCEAPFSLANISETI